MITAKEARELVLTPLLEGISKEIAEKARLGGTYMEIPLTNTSRAYVTDALRDAGYAIFHINKERISISWELPQ